MKFQVDSSSLSQSLQMVSRTISTKNLLGALDSILFELKGNTLKITAADLAHRMSVTIEVNNAGGVDGSFCIQGLQLAEAFKALPTQPVTFTVNVENMQVEVDYQNGHSVNTIVDATNYPMPLFDPAQVGTTVAEIPASALLNGITNALFAASTDERRPIMTGVFFDFLEDNLVFVATDGKMLVKHNDYNIKTEVANSFSLPRKACQLLRPVLAKTEENVKLTYTSNFIYFELGNYTLSARLLEGRFPNYKSVIPTNTPYQIKCERQALLSAIKRVSLFANQATKMIRLHLNGDKIFVSAKDLDLSSAAEETVKMEANQEVDILLGLDFEVLINILETMTSEYAIIDLMDHTRSVLLLPAETEEGIEVLNLVQPMRLVGED